MPSPSMFQPKPTEKDTYVPMIEAEGTVHMAVGVKTVLVPIPFWLVGEFTTHFRTYFSGLGRSLRVRCGF